MIGQEQDDYDSEEREGAEPHGRVIVGEDDMAVGQFVCVHSLKKQPNEVAPIMGQSFHIKAICWPYFVGQLLSDPEQPMLTLDCRYLNMMRVSEEFVNAQREGAKAQQRQQQQEGGMMMMPVQRKKRQKPQEDS